MQGNPRHANNRPQKGKATDGKRACVFRYPSQRPRKRERKSRERRPEKNIFVVGLMLPFVRVVDANVGGQTADDVGDKRLEVSRGNGRVGGKIRGYAGGWGVGGRWTRPMESQ